MLSSNEQIPLESVPCYHCGATESAPFIEAEDDLTGKPGRFTFVRCDACELVYQSPRVRMEGIKDYYDSDYIAHRKETRWGPLRPLYDWAMDKHDREKARLVARYAKLSPDAAVLDVGCAVGSFLQKLRKLHGVRASGVDFIDLSGTPGMAGIDFHCGLFYEAGLPAERFDLVTMWHFLEHDYDPLRSLAEARRVLKPDGHLLIEVPRLDSVSFRLFHERWPGLQAPQHTILFDKKKLLEFVTDSGFEVVDHLPYGAFPAYFYLFTGVAFKVLKGKGLNLRRAIYPYFVGQLLSAPVMMFEKRLNLAMQTVVCRKVRAH